MLSQGGDINIGIKDYLMYEGFTSKLVPIRNTISSSKGIGKVELDRLYKTVMKPSSWDALKRTDYYVDYQNLYTFLGVSPQREVFANLARKCLEAGDTTRAVTVLDKAVECVPSETYPLETVCIGFASNDLRVMDLIDLYYRAGQKEKARGLADSFEAELLQSSKFFLDFYDYAHQDFEYAYQMVQYMTDIYDNAGENERSEALVSKMEALLKDVVGDNG
jgi:tetratricopeptide (TPR) repeat protein